jgi:hypothetical protein
MVISFEYCIFPSLLEIPMAIGRGEVLCFDFVVIDSVIHEYQQDQEAGDAYDPGGKFFEVRDKAHNSCIVLISPFQI